MFRTMIQTAGMSAMDVINVNTGMNFLKKYPIIDRSLSVFNRYSDSSLLEFYTLTWVSMFGKYLFLHSIKMFMSSCST